MANVGYATLQIIPSIQGITGSVNSSLGGMAQAGQAAGKQLGQGIASGVEASKSAVEAASAKVAKSREKEADTAGKIKVAEAQLRTLREKGVTDAGRMASAEEKVSKAKRDHQSATNSTRTAEDKLTTATENVTKAEKAAADAAKDVSSKQGAMAKAADGAGTAFDKAAGKAKGFGKTLLNGIGFGAGMNIGGIASSLMEMGDTFATVNKTIAFTTGATGDRLAQLNQSVKTIGKESPKSMTDIATSIAEVAQKTELTGKPLEDLTKRMMKLDTIGKGVDIESVTQSMRAFGVPAEGMSAQLDRLYKISTATGMGIGELSSMAGAGAPQFKAMGLSIDDTALMLGSLHKAGVRGQSVTVGLNKAMVSLSKGGGNVKEKFAAAITEMQGFIKSGNDSAAMEKAGKLFGTKSAGQFIQAIKSGRMNVDELKKSVDGNKNGIMDAGGAITSMSGAWQMMKNNVLILIEPLVTKIFGAMQSGIKWFRSTGSEAIQNFGEKIKAAWNSEPVQNFISTVTRLFEQAWPVVVDLFNKAVEAGQKLAPILGPILLGAMQTLGDAIKTIAGIVGGFVGGLIDMAKFIGRNKEVFAALAGVITALFLPAIGTFIAQVAIAAVQSGLMTIRLTAWLIAQKAIAVGTKLWAAAQWILNAALNANPVGLIIAAIVALVAGIILAYKHSETFRKIVQGAWEGIKTAASAVWNGFLKPIFNAMKTAIGFVIDHWKIFAGVLALITGPVGIAVGAIVLIVKNFDKVKAAAGWVGDKVMWLWNSVMVPAFNGIKSVISGAWGGIKAIFGFFSDAFTNVGAVAGGVKDKIVEHFNAVVNFFKGLPGRITTAVKGLWDGIKNAFKDAINWVINKWNNFTLGFEFKIPIINKEVKFQVNTPDLPTLAGGGAIRDPDGKLSGPGTSRSDSILGVNAAGVPIVRVANQERVMTARSRGLGDNERIQQAMNGGRAFNLPGLADGGVVNDYGLDPGTNISYGAAGFPEWVNKLGQDHSVKPSTYAGHQESDRGEAGYAANPQHRNRGIDWSGSVDSMQKFAEYLLGIASTTPSLEQIIWQNPSTGQKIGWHGRQKDDGSYFASDYSGHTDHVHTRQSATLIAANVDLGNVPSTVNATPQEIMAKKQKFDQDELEFKRQYDKAQDDLKKQYEARIKAKEPGAKEEYETKKDDLKTKFDQDKLDRKQAFDRDTANSKGSNSNSGDNESPTQKSDKDLSSSISGRFSDAAKGAIDDQITDSLSVFGLPNEISWLKADALFKKSQEDQTKLQKDQKEWETNKNNGGTSSTSNTDNSSATPGTSALPLYGFNTALDGITDAEQTGEKDPGENKKVVQTGFGKHGWDKGQLWADSETLLNKESGFRNAVAYQGPVNSDAYGMFQFLSTTWAGAGGHKTDDPRLQTIYGGKYIADRYGDPSKALEHHLATNWYEEGGWLKPGATMALNGTGSNEAILNRSQWDTASHAIDAVQDLTSGNKGGGRVTKYITNATFRNEDEYYQRRAQEQRLGMSRHRGQLMPV